MAINVAGDSDCTTPPNMGSKLPLEANDDRLASLSFVTLWCGEDARQPRGFGNGFWTVAVPSVVSIIRRVQRGVDGPKPPTFTDAKRAPKSFLVNQYTFSSVVFKSTNRSMFHSGQRQCQNDRYPTWCLERQSFQPQNARVRSAGYRSRGVGEATESYRWLCMGV
ncbi:LOW QUALITY PROTEIN: hypothetical protein CVT26_012007 [Gymnopilus dilepis]|uniref:Uncharacterized protein n=1 Tax=Gymnopilus dilepis TaxID=231916 RepID=A0A409YHM0_9AGAR|nr:LOW QUALITY PROTEIN: hypothetical protein CVT26_012007 [Gymnopilus dilepis]